jgi:hypothetical protein
MDLLDGRQSLSNALGYVSRLVNHGSTIDHVDQPSRQRQSWTLRSNCQQPDWDDCRFAETGGNIDAAGQIPGDQFRPKPMLPPKRRKTSECLVMFNHQPLLAVTFSAILASEAIPNTARPPHGCEA